jgi:hypothetical protein
MSDTANAFRDSPTKVLAASVSLKFGILVGLAVAAYSSVWLLMVPNRQYYNWPDELGVFSALACTLFLFSVCWGAAWAYVIRRLDLPPKRCDLPLLTLLIPWLAGLLLSTVLGPAHEVFSSLMVFIFAAGGLAVHYCLKFAYPNVDRRDIYPSRPAGPAGPYPGSRF